MLHLADVVGHAREQLARRAAREEARRLPEDVPLQPVAQVAHDPLADVGHQVGGEVRAEALEDVEADDERGDERQVLAVRQHLVEDVLDQVCERRRCRRVHEHRRKRPREAQAIGRRVAKQSEERVHSVNRYFSSTQSAVNPSRQVIFLPSS